MNNRNKTMEQQPEQTINYTKIKNKAFSTLESLFYEYNWQLVQNEPNQITFKKENNDYDYFEINIDKNKIQVTIPLKKSSYKYTTYFTDYFSASEYIEMHINDYEGIKPI
jgi:hypothetical protein